MQIKLDQIVEQLCIADSYIGCVAQAEVHIWQSKREKDNGRSGSAVEIVLGESPGVNQMLALGGFKDAEDNENHELQTGLRVLEELSMDNPDKILAYVKLFQFYRCEAIVDIEDNRQDHLQHAMEVAEKL
jgi:hypothetical protein